VRLALVNPNTSPDITRTMVRIAAETAGRSVAVTGHTAPFGVALITAPEALDVAADAVLALASDLADADAVIVAAFGDPGLGALRDALQVPVTGIAEAGMAEAARGGRRFAVATTTPALRDAIAASAARYGHDNFAGSWTTPGDPVALIADPLALEAALAVAIDAAVRDGGAEAVVIGGGPLALAARALASRSPVPLVEPIPAAVRLSLDRLKERARS
jgi:Asp/Glu/hydantoin racemase